MATAQQEAAKLTASGGRVGHHAGPIGTQSSPTGVPASSSPLPLRWVGSSCTSRVPGVATRPFAPQRPRHSPDCRSMPRREASGRCRRSTACTERETALLTAELIRIGLTQTGFLAAPAGRPIGSKSLVEKPKPRRGDPTGCVAKGALLRGYQEVVLRKL